MSILKKLQKNMEDVDSKILSETASDIRARTLDQMAWRRKKGKKRTFFDDIFNRP
jgi:hypothetical protein